MTDAPETDASFLCRFLERVSWALVHRDSVMMCCPCVMCRFVQLDGADEIKKAQDQLNKQLFEMDSNLQRIAAPNMKALEK